MDFNQAPYYDDFDANKQYYKVMFKPGVAVQTREMNQLQSILQDQITKFGNHMFKDGSVVIPGQVNYNDKLNFIKISATSLGSYDLTWLEDKEIGYSQTGTTLKGRVIKALPATDIDPITLIILYTGSNQDAFGANDTIFQPGTTLYVLNEAAYSVTVQNSVDATGRSVAAGIQAGVYYLNGYFVTVPTETIAVQKYVTDINTLSARVGIQYTESFVSYQEDNSLIDNAGGSRNYAAPGADRYQMSTAFISVGLDETPLNFYELIRVENGVLQQINNGSNYNILQDTLARRTFDESGNYVVDEFKFDVRESRTNNRGAWSATQAYSVNDFILVNNRYFVCIRAGTSGTSQPALFDSVDETTSFLDGTARWRYVSQPISNRGTSLNGNESDLIASFGLGKAYIQGYEVSKTANSRVVIPKARDTKSDTNRFISTPVGAYIFLDKLRSYGLPDIGAGQTLRFYDRIVGDPTINKFGYGLQVGTAKAMWVDNDNMGALKIGLTDIQMEQGKTFDRDVNSVAVWNDDSSITTTKTYQLSGTAVYTGDTSTYVSITGSLYFAGATSSQFNTLLSQPANTSLTFVGAGTYFNNEMRTFDTISTNNGTSSWSVRNINSDSSITVYGSLVSGVVPSQSATPWAFGSYNSANTALWSTSSFLVLGQLTSSAIATAGTVSGATVYVTSSTINFNSTSLNIQVGSQVWIAASSTTTSAGFWTALTSTAVYGYVTAKSTSFLTLSLTSSWLVAGQISSGTIALTYYNYLSSTAIQNLLAPGTLQGIGPTSTGTRFLSETRSGDKVYIASAATTATTVTNVVSEQRMVVSTASTTRYTSSAVNFGAYYNNVVSKFSGDVYQNYSLGINAKKLTGLYQLLDYSGNSGTTISAHQAIQIRGTNDGKLISEASSGDLVFINDQRIFITNISSNTVAFGICLNNAITSSATQYPAISLGTTLSETNYPSLLYSVNTATKSITDNSYRVYRTKTLSPAVGDTSVTFTLDGASGSLAADNLYSANPADFLVAQTVIGSLSNPLTVTNVNYNSGTRAVVLTLSAALTANQVRVIFPVERRASAGALGGYQSKTLTYDQSDTFLNSSVATQTILPLRKADVYRVNKILAATTFVNAWDATVQATAIDITNNYRLDDGQRDTTYNPGSLIRKSGYPAPNGSVKVFYDYFEHGDGDFFCGASYNPLEVPYEAIPNYNGKSLNDVLDFRGLVDPVTGLMTNNAVPVYGTGFYLNDEYYLGRKDKLFLDKNGTFYSVSGSSSIAPEDPQISETNSTLELVKLELEAYTRATEFPHLKTTQTNHRRFTMKDIGSIEKRVTALEEATTLSLLETKTNSLQVRDNKDPTLERYKTGFFVDNFTDSSNADDSGDARFAIDPVAQTLNASVSYHSFPVVEKINFTASSSIAGEEIPQRDVRTYQNYRMTGDTITLDYTTSTMLQQTLATDSISVAPFLTANFMGSMKITPDADVYTSTNAVNKITADPKEAEKLAAAVAAYRATRNTRPYRVSVSQTNTLTQIETTKTEIPFIRANTVSMVAKGLKPNTKHFIFFDDEDVGQFVTGASKFTMNSIDTLSFDNSRPNAKNEWARWRSLYQTKDMWEVVRARQVRYWGGWWWGGWWGWWGGWWGGWRTRWVYDYGWVRHTFVPRALETNLPSSARNDSSKKALEAGAVVYYYNGGYTGSAVAIHQDGTTLYCVNQRGTLSPTYLRQGKNQSRDLPGAFYVANTGAHASFLGTTTITAQNTLTDDGVGGFYTDSKGTFVGLFDLPDSDIHKFLTGKKPLVITDSVDNDPDNWTSRADAIYTSEGWNITVTRDYQTTKSFNVSAIPVPHDPIAQSFKIPDQFGEGAFITDIDVYFQAKPESSMPVVLEMRSCGDDGRPSANDVLPGSTVTKFPEDIVVDATTGQVPTKFTFSSPIYLSPNKNYSFVLKADTKAYRVWIATLGRNDVFDKNKSYSTQATLGSLFKSQDGTLWTEDQLSDIKFRINRAVFNTNKPGIVRVVNQNLPADTLSNNPFWFTHGSNYVKVGHYNHGFRAGDHVRFYSPDVKAAYEADPTYKIFGIPAVELFGDTLTEEQTLQTHSYLTVSNVTLDTYTVTTATPAFINAAAVTGVTVQTGGGANINALANSLYHVVTPAVKMLSFQSTEQSLQAQMLTGHTYDGDATVNQNYTMNTQELTFNTVNFMNEPKIVLTDANEYYRVAGTSVTTGTNVDTWKDSFIGNIRMLTTNDAVSPAIDLSTFHLNTIQHRIDNPSKATRLPSPLPAVTDTSNTLLLKPIAIANTSITVNGVTDGFETGITGFFGNIMPGKYIIASGFNTAANNAFTSTGLLVTGISPNADKIYVAQNLVTELPGAAITIYQIEDYTEEATREDASGESKYICRKVSLQNPASQLKLIIDGNIPSAADFDIYYKVDSAATNFDGLVWKQFTNMPVINKTDTRGSFTEITIDITDFDSNGNPKDFSAFTAFQLKIVFRSVNAARMPQFKNMRVIAHA